MGFFAFHVFASLVWSTCLCAFFVRDRNCSKSAVMDCHLRGYHRSSSINHHQSTNSPTILTCASPVVHSTHDPTLPNPNLRSSSEEPSWP